MDDIININPLVSVILPVYNGEMLLGEAITSVLKQNYRPIEIIIVDDGSTDKTAQIAQGYGSIVRYYYQKNAGAAAARNLGIRKANGEYIAFIDTDDLWPDNKLRFQMDCFQTFPSVEIVQGLIRRITLPGLVKGRIIGGDIDFLYICSNLGSMVMHRSVFDKIGYFEESFQFHEDTDLWIRARNAGIKILVQRKESLIYRIHGSNLTTGVDLIRTDFLNIIRRSINQRRNEFGFVKPNSRLIFIPDLLKKDHKGDLLRNRGKITWPLVSIILHIGQNRSKLNLALESINQQEYSPIELVIVGSQLEKVRVPASKQFNRVEIIDNDSQDLSLQLNAGLDKCNGEFIAFLDSDVEWAPGKLELQATYLHDNSSVGYTVGRTCSIIDPKRKYPAEIYDGLSFRKNLGDLLDSLMVRKSVFEKVGRFITGLSGMEETDWQLRAKDSGISSKTLPQVLLFRFVEPDSFVFETKQLETALLKSLRLSVHRKHSAGK